MRRAGAVIAVALLTVGGFLVRLHQVTGVDGTLGEDEARMVLAARGVLQTGLPTMPSGMVYARGLVNSYLTAGAFLLFGQTDAASRLPNITMGTLLTPIMFLFGCRLSGRAAGLALAAFTAFQPELIQWSASAWMTSLFVVLLVSATYWLYAGFARDEPRSQVLGAAVSLLTVLAHELGALLALTVGAYLAVRIWRRDRGWYFGRTTWLALALLTLGLVAFAGLGAYLRASTVAGAASEFSYYFGPSFSTERFLLDVARWYPRYLLLIGLTAVGLFVALRRRHHDGLLLFMLMAGAGLAIWVVIPKTNARYGLVFLPMLALLATWTLARLVAVAAGRFAAPPEHAARIASALFILIFGVSIWSDVRAAVRWPAPRTATWVTEIHALGFSRDDLVFSDTPELPAFYLGRVDYWDRPRDFERYSYPAHGELRHLYTGAVRIGHASDLDAKVRSRRGTLWYVGEDLPLSSYPQDVRDRFLGQARLVRRTTDQLVVVRWDLSDDAR